MQNLACFQCHNPFPAEECKYFFDEKFYIKGSTRQLPFCSPKCSTEHYREGGWINKTVLKGVKG